MAQRMKQTPRIRETVQAEIDRRGYTIQEVADLSGSTREQLSRWLSGKQRAREDVLQRIFDALGLEVKRNRK